MLNYDSLEMNFLYQKKSSRMEFQNVHLWMKLVSVADGDRTRSHLLQAFQTYQGKVATDVALFHFVIKTHETSIFAHHILSNKIKIEKFTYCSVNIIECK